MAEAYLCPNCKTNRTRFNLIKQEPEIVKLDSHTGEVLDIYTPETIEAYHFQYKGPNYKVQCGVCGLLEDEQHFVKYASYRKEDTHE